MPVKTVGRKFHEIVSETQKWKTGWPMSYSGINERDCYCQGLYCLWNYWKGLYRFWNSLRNWGHFQYVSYRVIRGLSKIPLPLQISSASFLDILQTLTSIPYSSWVSFLSARSWFYGVITRFHLPHALNACWNLYRRSALTMAIQQALAFLSPSSLRNLFSQWGLR